MSRERILAPHRAAPIAVVLILALAAIAAANGPTWYQRLYHPLRYEDLIASNAQKSGLDPYLVCAVINAESGFDAADVSAQGAVGLMQVLPDTAAEVARTPVTVEALKTPSVNIAVGTRYLSALIKRYGRTDVALAAYNAGSANADEWVKKERATGKAFIDVIGFPETRRYVRGVAAQQRSYETLYPSAFAEEARK